MITLAPMSDPLDAVREKIARVVCAQPPTLDFGELARRAVQAGLDAMPAERAVLEGHPDGQRMLADLTAQIERSLTSVAEPLKEAIEVCGCDESLRVHVVGLHPRWAIPIHEGEAVPFEERVRSESYDCMMALTVRGDALPSPSFGSDDEERLAEAIAEAFVNEVL